MATALKSVTPIVREVPHTVSPGLWALAWKRLKSDNVGMVSLAIVAAFILIVPVTIVLVFAIQARVLLPDLRPWHRLVLNSEFRAGGSDTPKTFEEYVQLENRLFAELRSRVMDDPNTADRYAIGRFNPAAITNITPDSKPYYHMDWAKSECFRDPAPVAQDYFLVSHAPQKHFALYAIDRFGNRELLYLDPRISSMCPTPLRPRPVPPVARLREFSPRRNGST